MPKNMRNVMDDFQKVQADLFRDHPYLEDPEDPEHGAMCHVLHRELGLGETPATNVENGSHVTPDDESIDYTVEHIGLHGTLTQIKQQALRVYGPAASDQMLSFMWIIGRRMGMYEAATLMGEDLMAPAEDWLDDDNND